MARDTRRRGRRYTPDSPVTARERRRAYSQNLLTDTATARRIVRASGVGPTDTVVEVGAGTGMLTRLLAPACGLLTAYEIDPRLAARLRSRIPPAVRVVEGDFRRARPPQRPFHLVGNIPYGATADIVRWCLEAPQLASATLVTQLEYARKRTGGFGRWSLLTVRSWPEFDWRMAGRIPRERFAPVPRVDSAVLRLIRRERPLLPREELGAYRAAVELGFSGAGGSLRASLRRGYGGRRVDAALAAAGIGRTDVVAHVSPDQWIALHARLNGRRR
ncbi:ErmE/ErmH/ErmO/ErmR family 23S rRNA (adenine(2058)-N(6))-methyltransferase [Streptomonospora sp. PA3]|uniref:ErmE/ErmH/ErmO/ErmR family 23S rRNA (adenine(2058)-N(6))-methyltransferase n=1 Tax=Streptomonospora sp. PA3 TaxID=2607326 RepID=UPI0012DE3BC3|nr:ErmE/ErmH/ErmO/ErmR family 23S rRNA (adenine(2058)-N(6))-methyltransferase [Streptomonospora sp. PA3]MUL40558.1 ErmE/ErmH/ErmO/ErmR family 23S rRNA (adenine(2058)-N(6))-methyltransferase [Streptomonospora sp. PA3]